MAIGSIQNNRWANLLNGKQQSSSGGDSFSSLLDAVQASQSTAAGKSCDAPVSLDALRQDADGRLAELRRTLNQLLSDAGVDTTHEITLEDDGAGGIHVGGDHPDAQQIEDLLEENPDLAAKFKALQQSYQKLRSAEETTPSAPPAFGPTFVLKMLNGDAKAELR